jgi:hypothetical protein
MYFTTFNHYDDNDIMYDNHYNIIYNNEQCLICWDKYTTNNNVYKMQSLFSSSMYYTYCTCNGYFHENCLLKWIYKTNSCPICRVKLEIDIDENLPLTFNILKIYKLFKLFFTFILIRILYDIIFDIQYTIEKKLQNDQL